MQTNYQSNIEKSPFSNLASELPSIIPEKDFFKILQILTPPFVKNKYEFNSYGQILSKKNNENWKTEDKNKYQCKNFVFETPNKKRDDEYYQRQNHDYIEDNKTYNINFNENKEIQLTDKQNKIVIQKLDETKKKIQYQKEDNHIQDSNLKLEIIEQQQSELFVTDPALKQFKCNCKQSRCLKLYCECFINKEGCGPSCNCCHCENNDQNTDKRKLQFNFLLEKNKDAFTPKIIEQAGTEVKKKHIKGCNCKKNNCQKNYCECYQAQAKCSELCKCYECHNVTQTDNQHEAKNCIDLRKKVKKDYTQ